MRVKLLNLIVALSASAALAQFLVLFYCHWYFAGVYWPKWLALGILLVPVYLWLLRTQWEKVWLGLGIYWTLLIAGFMLGCGSSDLSRLGFTAVLNLEAPMVWLPAAVVIAWAGYGIAGRERERAASRRAEVRALQLRRRLRRQVRGIATVSLGAAALAGPVRAHNELEDEMGVIDFASRPSMGEIEDEAGE